MTREKNNVQSSDTNLFLARRRHVDATDTKMNERPVTSNFHITQA